jgi:thioredoxin 1
MNRPAKFFLWLAAGFAGAGVLQMLRGPVAEDNLPRLTDGTFGPFIGRDAPPVLVDFYADWCGPCRTIAPTVAALSREYAGRLEVAKLNTDHAQLTAHRYKVKDIPTLILFRASNEVDRVSGPKSAVEYRAWLDRHLAPATPATPAAP